MENPYDTYDVAQWDSVDEDPGPDVRELESDVEVGKACDECGTTFVKAHAKAIRDGFKVVCTYCGARKLEGLGYKMATHREANAEAHASRNRKRKESKKAGSGAEGDGGAGKGATMADRASTEAPPSQPPITSQEND